MDYAEEMAQRLTLTLQGESRNSFARRIGMPESTLRSYFEGIAMSLEAAARIAEGSGVSLQWLATGEGPMLAGSVHEAIAYFPSGLEDAGEADLPSEGLFDLPRLVVHRGFPALRHEESCLSIPRRLLAEIKVAPEAAAGLVVEEGLPKSRFPRGSILIVDTGSGSRGRRSTYYVLVSDGNLIVRLIARRADGGFDLIADYPDARPQRVASLDKLVIAGPVVWAGAPV